MWRLTSLAFSGLARSLAAPRLVADLEKGESLNVACKIRQGFDYSIHGAVPRLLSRLGPASEFSAVCCRAKANVQRINQELQEFAMLGQQPGMQNQITPHNSCAPLRVCSQLLAISPNKVICRTFVCCCTCKHDASRSLVMQEVRLLVFCA